MFRERFANTIRPLRGLLSFACAVMLCVIMAAPQAHADTKGAEQFVQQNIDKGYAILNNASLSSAQKTEQFRTFLLSITDFKRIATFTLGQYTRQANQADTDAFVKAFQNFASAVYEHNLNKYKGQTMKVTGSQERAADDIVVNAQVVDTGSSANSDAIRVAFRVRKNDQGGNIITDLQVEGAWLAINQRADFTSYLQQHGGKVPALTQELVRQADEIRSGTDPDSINLTNKP
jgi:phospholipid transport system substrate-binding protein